MKYIVENEVLMKIMEEFFRKHFPDIELPLHVHRTTGKGNRGYGSAMDDYTFINTYYFAQKDDEDTLFVNYDDRYWQDNKWYVTGKFEIIYDFFGEKSFEDFVKWYFGLDITEKGNKKYNWLFD